MSHFGLGLTSLRSHARPSSEVLRIVSSSNQTMRAVDSVSGANTKADRWPHYLPQQTTSVAFCWNNWYLNSSSPDNVLTPPNGVTLSAATAECNGVVVPLTFAGQSSVTLQPGDNNIRCDSLTPAQFGLNSFAAGTTIWTKTLLNLPSAGDKVLFSERNANDVSGSQSLFLDSGATTLSDILLTGAFTSSGTSPSTRINGFAPWCIGTPANSSTPIWLARGDSITQGIGDNKSDMFGRGWFQRACESLQSPCLNMGISGSQGNSGASDDRVAYWYRFATHGVVFYGTNDFGASGTNNSLITVQTRVQTIASAMRNHGMAHVGISKLLVRSTSSDSWASEANQTVNAGWQAGDRPDQFNTSLSGLGFDFSLPFDSIRGNDSYKWRATGPANDTTADGEHPSPNGHSLMAAEASIIMAAL
jgi:hypothetical protein